MTDKTEKNMLMIILGIITVVGVLVAGAAFLPGGQEDNKIVAYNTFVFEKKQDDFWYTQVQQGDLAYELPLRYNPYDVENVEVVGKLNAIQFGGGDIYITFDPDSEKFSHIALGAAELSLSLGSVFNKPPLPACTFDDGTETCEGLDVVTCEDTDKSVVYLRDVDVPPRVTLQGNCVILEGKDFDLIKSIDRVLYLWLNIMPAQ
jgi:hypothetical protein